MKTESQVKMGLLFLDITEEPTVLGALYKNGIFYAVQEVPSLHKVEVILDTLFFFYDSSGLIWPPTIEIVSCIFQI